MGASATLSTSVNTVQPGQEATCQVVVANTGTVVDHFTVEVVGDAAAWTVVEPPSVNLMPDESATVTLRFAPPRSAEVASRSVPFAVHVSSHEEPSGSVVEEGTIDVAPFTEVTIELVPPRAEGSRKANYEVVLDNAGNHQVDLELNPVDPEDQLVFRLARSRLALDSGTAAFVSLSVRPRHRFLRGQPQRHPFQVFASLGYGDPLVADGVMVQRQLLPRWLVPALIAALVAAVALVALWLGLLRPAVKSAARAAAAEQATELKSSAQEARADAGAAKQEAAQAKQNADRALIAQGLNPTDTNAPPITSTPAVPATQPIDFRIPTNAPIVTDVRNFREFSFTPEDTSKTLLITDLVLQNPRGNSGTLQIRRDKDGTKTVLLEVGLNNFRDLDQHWVQPWLFRPGEKVVVAVSCQNPPELGNCTPAVSFSGRLES
jgi:type II secretory pathway pseudopilin PulG